MKSPFAKLSGIFGLAGPERPKTDQEEDLLCDQLLPAVHVRGVPSEIVVVDGATHDAERARRTGAVRLVRVLANLSKLCRHREGFDCGVCRDMRALSDLVAVHGRCRCLPG